MGCQVTPTLGIAQSPLFPHTPNLPTMGTSLWNSPQQVTLLLGDTSERRMPDMATA